MEIEGTRSGENMGGIVLDLLDKLDIGCKLLSITCDNAGNNETLINEVNIRLCEWFTNCDEPISGEGLHW
jgi:hypothetical protein